MKSGIRLAASLLLLLLSLQLWIVAAPTRAAIPSNSGIFRPVEVDPVPDNALRVCESCDVTDLQLAIDESAEGATIVVEGGTWSSIEITHPLRLVGQNMPVIDAEGTGTGIRIASDDVSIEGFDVRNSGRRFEKEDSGIYFEGERTKILNNRVSQSLFGINGATGHDSVIAGNEVVGQQHVQEGLRGDGIKVWYSHRVAIHNNYVSHSRDLLVWYSNNCEVYENLVTYSRYGFHFMNSDDGVAHDNEIINNSVGIYVMYGKRFHIENNLLQGSRGPSGHGLGLKEVDGIDVIGNVIYDNRIGVYNDNSPFSMNVYGTFHDNLIAFNDSGLGILPSARANVYTNNSFIENLEQVTILGSGPLSDGNQWTLNGSGNYWSDYAGYDADGDGIGDVPYNHSSPSEELRRSRPLFQLYRFSLAETAVDFAAKAVPLFAPQPILVDTGPLVKPVLPENAPEAFREPANARSTVMPAGLLAVVGVTIWWGTRNSRINAQLDETS